MALIFIVITGDFANVWIQGLMLSIGLLFMSFMTLYPVLAGGVFTAAIKSCANLKTIQIVNGRHFSRLINRQLSSLIDKLSSKRFPISFYCLNFFPFKSMTTFEVGMT